MTVGIAAICNMSDDEYPMIVFCADRQVTGELQFDSPSSKISQITENSCLIQSSNDLFLSSKVISNIQKKLPLDNTKTIEEISDIVAEECVKMKEEKAEKDIIQKYNFATKKIGADPNSLIKDVIQELRFYDYPSFEFILCGIDEIGIQAHLFKINQDGDSSCWDNHGFAATGSGEGLAFFGMTKYRHSHSNALAYSLPSVYFAKKIAELSTGVGKYTDVGILYFGKEEGNKSFNPLLAVPSNSSELMNELNTAFNNIGDYEKKEINNMKSYIEKSLNQGKKSNQ